jgi:hypothetical protein
MPASPLSNSTSLTMPPLWQLLWMALAGSLLYLFAVRLRPYYQGNG